METLELEDCCSPKGQPEFSGWTVSDNASREKTSWLCSPTILLAQHMKSRLPIFAWSPYGLTMKKTHSSVNKEVDRSGSQRACLETGPPTQLTSWPKAWKIRLPVTVERFPPAGPSPYFDWGAMLQRIEALSKEIAATGLCDAEQIVLVPPWRA